MPAGTCTEIAVWLVGIAGVMNGVPTYAEAATGVVAATAIITRARCFIDRFKHWTLVHCGPRHATDVGGPWREPCRAKRDGGGRPSRRQINRERPGAQWMAPALWLLRTWYGRPASCALHAATRGRRGARGPVAYSNESTCTASRSMIDAPAASQRSLNADGVARDRPTSGRRASPLERSRTSIVYCSAPSTA